MPEPLITSEERKDQWNPSLNGVNGNMNELALKESSNPVKNIHKLYNDCDIHRVTIFEPA